MNQYLDRLCWSYRLNEIVLAWNPLIVWFQSSMGVGYGLYLTDHVFDRSPCLCSKLAYHTWYLTDIFWPTDRPRDRPPCLWSGHSILWGIPSTPTISIMYQIWLSYWPTTPSYHVYFDRPTDRPIDRVASDTSLCLYCRPICIYQYYPPGRPVGVRYILTWAHLYLT